jgi:hypothetical protein
MILKVAEMESRLFITAEKAPFLICIEVFQPQEIQMHIQQEFNDQRPRAFEILNKPKICDIDPARLLQKVNFEISKAQYVNTTTKEVQQAD